MKLLFKLAIATLFASVLNGCASMPSYTQKDSNPQYAYVNVTNYDRIHVGDGAVSVSVETPDPSKVKLGFDTSLFKNDIEKELSERGFSVKPTGKKIIVKLYLYDYTGYANKSVHNDSGVAGTLFGAGASLGTAVAAGIVTDKLTEEEKKNLATGSVFEVIEPSTGFKTKVTYQSRQKTYDFTPKVEAKYMAHMVNEFILH
ncbi:hypothetical protein [Hydrogenovibrio marinus]|uniref:TraT complement resistance protein n=1 Tax=Hydrogenovibrio marinus TaxID=28885 RepID=A0A066ZLP6_HYDMR|nr:hypothetical protein [Hydrogenovibrio marinus]KDN94718.1 hypothetical protein EI16_12540 [Hydrogenovibrio marinus]